MTDSETDERRRLADAYVTLGRHLMNPGLPLQTLGRVADQIDAVLRTDLSGPVPLTRYSEEQRAAFADRQGDVDASGRHPLRGFASPGRMDFVTNYDERGLARSFVVTFDVRHEGLPGRAHGAFVAGLFDVTLGKLAIDHRGGGVTTDLVVRFLRPAPLHATVEYGGTVTSTGPTSCSIDGYARLAGRETVAEARALFVLRQRKVGS